MIGFPHEKINQCLTDINRCLTDISRYLTDTENQFYKISVISVKYRFTQISTLMIFNQYLTDTNRYILETNIISKISQVSLKYWLNISLFYFLS